MCTTIAMAKKKMSISDDFGNLFQGQNDLDLVYIAMGLGAPKGLRSPDIQKKKKAKSASSIVTRVKKNSTNSTT